MEEKNKIVSRFVVQHSHLDLFGHMNNVAFFRVLEDARWDWMLQRGFNGLDEVKTTGKGPIILEANARFRKEMKLGESFTISTAWQSFRKKIGILEQVIKNANAEEVCRAHLTLAIVDLTTRKIITPDSRWREVFAIPDRED
jgi:YbgC/YbaW family acyl-CoA thioester hydrolase